MIKSYIVQKGIINSYGVKTSDNQKDSLIISDIWCKIFIQFIVCFLSLGFLG